MGAVAVEAVVEVAVADSCEVQHSKLGFMLRFAAVRIKLPESMRESRAQKTWIEPAWSCSAGLCCDSSSYNPIRKNAMRVDFAVARIRCVVRGLCSC